MSLVLHGNLKRKGVPVSVYNRPNGCYGELRYSTAEAYESPLDRKKGKFLHRRLRGAHVSPSSSITRPLGHHRPHLEALDGIKLPPTENRPSRYCELLRSCGKLKAGILGMLIHHHIIKDGLDHVEILQNLIVQMYTQCDFMYEACAVFDSLPFRDEFLWNFMLRACSQHEDGNEASQMFDKMLGEGILPNKHIYTSVLLTFSNSEVLKEEGERLHARLDGNDLNSDALLESILVSMYCKCSCLDDARRMFDRLNEPEVTTWNNMIGTHTKRGEGKMALNLYKKMQQEGTLPNKVTYISVLDACSTESVFVEGLRVHACFPGSMLESDLVLGTALINLYGKFGDLNNARTIFDQMPEQNTVTWNGMMTAYALQSQAKSVLALFDQMLQQGMLPDKFIFVSMFSVHATKEDLVHGKRLYSRLLSIDFQSDAVVLTAVLNMFCKCGSMRDAEAIFHSAPSFDEVIWTSMISGYAQHGQGKKALQTFERMELEGPPPTLITYLSVFSACSKDGLVDQGVRHLLSMSRKHGIKPTVYHFNCVIDLLARSGRLDEAEDIIRSMSGEATSVSWNSLLDACRRHLDMERGNRTAQRMFQMDPDNVSPYVLLSNITTACAEV